MKNLARKKNLMVTALALILAIGCGTYEDGPNFSLRTKKARLTGTWIVMEVDGQRVDTVNTELEFEADGDFSFLVNFGLFPISRTGEWSWEEGKEKLEVTVDGSPTEWEIRRLTNRELWFEDEVDNLWKCEKE